jgi:hypothetical protein
MNIFKLIYVQKKKTKAYIFYSYVILDSRGIT